MPNPKEPQFPAAKRGFFFNVGSLVFARAVLALSQILVLPLMARYLSIEDFAIMALAMVVVVFCTVLSDAGLGRSLIRSKTYDPAEWSTVFWLLVGVGTALALLTVLLAFVWAAFFDSEELVPVLCVLTIVPLLQAICAAPNAEIERRENYAGIARVQIITTIISLSIAVLLAVLGAGVWALVAQQVALAAVRLIGTLSLTRFRPNMTFQPRLLGTHLRFAKDSLSVAAIAAFGQQGIVMLIGKLLGTVPLGIFSMSQRFTRLPQFGLAGPMSTVVYVRMTKAQDDEYRLVDIYLASLRLLSFAILPAMATVAVAGEAIFTVALSEAWAPVAPVFALSIGGLAVEAVSVVCLTSLFRATGRTELNVRLAIESTFIQLTLVLIGSLFSLQAAAFGITAWGILTTLRAWALARRVVPLKLEDCLLSISASCLAAGLIVLGHLVLNLVLVLNHTGEILMVVAVWAMVTLSMSLLSQRGLKRAVDQFKQPPHGTENR